MYSDSPVNPSDRGVRKRQEGWWQGLAEGEIRALTPAKVAHESHQSTRMGVRGLEATSVAPGALGGREWGCTRLILSR